MSVTTPAVARNGNGIDRPELQAGHLDGNHLQSPAMNRALFTPKTPQDVWQLSEMLSQSNFIPEGYRGQPANIMVAMGLGSEVGLAPLQSLQNICVINGQPAVYGDALLALVMASPLCLMYEDGWDDESQCAWAHTQRDGGSVREQVFSLDTAKRAGLLSKKGPWQQYPERMCKMRARSWLCRDVYPDILKGLSVVRVLDDAAQPRTQARQLRNQPSEQQPREPLPVVDVVNADDCMGEDEKKPEPTEEERLAVNMIIDDLGEASTQEAMKAIKADIKALPEHVAQSADLINLWNTRRQQLKTSKTGG